MEVRRHRVDDGGTPMKAFMTRLQPRFAWLAAFATAALAAGADFSVAITGCSSADAEAKSRTTKLKQARLETKPNAALAQRAFRDDRENIDFMMVISNGLNRTVGSGCRQATPSHRHATVQRCGEWML